MENYLKIIFSNTDSQNEMTAIDRFGKPFKVYFRYSNEKEKYIIYYKYHDKDEIQGYREIKSEESLLKRIAYHVSGNEKNKGYQELYKDRYNNKNINVW